MLHPYKDTYRNTCGWRIGLTETFRNRSAKLLDKYGTNLQNPSDHICRMYEPDDGKVFVQVDQAGAEALIVAYLCKGPNNLRKLFEHNIKPHVYVAMHLFKSHWQRVGHPIVNAAVVTPIEALRSLPGWDLLERAIKKHERYYFIGKKTCHASNYDMGPKTFRMAVLTESEGKTVISHQDATTFLETYHKLFPEIREWHNETTSILRKTRTLRNLFGYPRLFTGPMQPHTFKEAFAFVPQSTVGVLGNMAFVEEQGYIEEHEKDWDLLNNKHDSTLTQCPIDEAQECAKVKRKIVEKELISPWGEVFKMRSEASIGLNWGHYDEKENPKGLKEL